MKIILRQFVIVNPDTKEEQRSKHSFLDVIRAYKRGDLYLEQCETIKQKGFVFNYTYRKVLIGRLGRKLNIRHYSSAKASINA